MARPYAAPSLVEYGTVAAITGETGTAAENDWWLSPNGDATQRGFTGSIDGCAEEVVGGNRKCICADTAGGCDAHP